MTTYMFKLFRGRFQSYWIYKLYTMRTWTLLSSNIKIYQIRLDQAKWNNSINNYFCFRDHISFHNILSNQFSALWRIDCADGNVRVSIKLGHPQPVSIHFMKKRRQSTGAQLANSVGGAKAPFGGVKFFGKIRVKLRIFRALKTVIKPLIIRKLSVNLTIMH